MISESSISRTRSEHTLEQVIEDDLVILCIYIIRMRSEGNLRYLRVLVESP